MKFCFYCIAYYKYNMYISTMFVCTACEKDIAKDVIARYKDHSYCKKCIRELLNENINNNNYNYEENKKSYKNLYAGVSFFEWILSYK